MDTGSRGDDRTYSDTKVLCLSADANDASALEAPQQCILINFCTPASESSHGRVPVSPARLGLGQDCRRHRLERQADA
jgi:hypothetical protein